MGAAEAEAGRSGLNRLKAWYAAAAAKSLQSCLTLCDPIDGSPPGSPSLGFSRQEYCWAPNYHNETTAIYKAASEPGTVQAHWLTKTSNNHSRENYY